MKKSASIAGLGEKELMAAYASRDARFDGVFFVGVKSTGIFCRPVCPARTALAKNVAFHASAASAMAAGLRPCLRCSPERAPEQQRHAGRAPLVESALSLISEGILASGSLEELSAKVGVSARHLRRMFEQELGASPIQVEQTRRLLLAKELVSGSAMPLGQAALAAGFSSARRFNSAFLQAWGKSPGAMRKSGLGKEERKGAWSLALPGIDEEGLRQALNHHALRLFAGVERVDLEKLEWERTARTKKGAGLVGMRWGKEGAELFGDAGSLELMASASARVKRMLGLGAPLEAVLSVLRKDKGLAPALKTFSGRVCCAWDAWEQSVRALLGQQISVKAAGTLAARLALRFGEKWDGCEGFGLLFPEPEALARAKVSDLRSIGLTESRAKSLQALSAHVASKPMWRWNYPGLEKFEKEMIAIPGIGPWTARYCAMRGFADADAFPASDLGLIQAARKLGLAQTPKELEARSERWRPWRAHAAQALWHFNGASANAPAEGIKKEQTQIAKKRRKQ